MSTLFRWGLIVSFVVVSVGCEKKKRGGDSNSASSAKDTTSALWALAPPGSPAGLVIGDGAPVRSVALATSMWALVGERPWVKPYLDEARAEVLKDAPFDVFDAAAWKTAGFDLSKGAAIFAADDGREPALMVLPVGDRAAFVKTIKATTEKQGNRDVDKLDDIVCTTAGDRYLCAASLDLIDQAVKKHDSRLATTMKALPKEARGDVEAYADVKKLPSTDRDMPDEIWGSLRFGDDGVAMHVWMKGPQLAPAMMALGAGKVASDLKEHSGRSAMVMRVQLNAGMLASQVPPIPPVGAIDPKKDVIDQMTGDFQLVSTAEGKLGAMLMIGVKDAAPVAKALQHGCELARAALASEGQKGVKLEYDDNACVADVDLAALGVAGADKLRLRAAVEGKMATIAVGDVDPKSFAGNAEKDAGSPEAKQILGGDWPYVFWMRGFDFGSGLPAAMVAQLSATNPQAAQGIDMASWLGAHLYEIAFATRFENGAMLVVGRVTTVGGDAPEVRKAYGDALRKRFAGDTAGWQAGIGEIQKKHPDSMAARMGAASAGTAFVVGTLTSIGVASFNKYLEQSRAAGAASMPTEPAE
jgi:hypothetical protein